MALDLKLPGIIATFLIGCKWGGPEVDLRAEPATLPDTTLPDDDDSWKEQPSSKPGMGMAFRDGVATATEPPVAEAAAKVMADGGNAIDAAVTALFVLNVAEPQSSGVGGGGFVLIRLEKTNETIALNCRETAPAAADPLMFGDPPPAFAVRASSGYAVGVPGMVACAAAMLEKWGTISLAEALQPAIEAATHGIEVSARLAKDTDLTKLKDNEPGVTAYEVARSVFRPDGLPLQPGAVLVQPDLAKTFQLLAEFGPDAFYRCDHEAGIALAIVEAQKTTRTINDPAGVGRMECEDLAAYEVQEQEPISGTYRGYEIVTVPPPSAGGIAVLQSLAMLEQFPMGDDSKGFGFGDYATLNVTIDAIRLALADRGFWVGDDDCPDVNPLYAGCTDVPVTGLLDDDYLAVRGAMIEVGKRLVDIQQGPADDYPLSAANSIFDEGNDTTHVSIVDRFGNMVSLTMSIEETWGTGIMVPGLGFLLNNQLTDFNAVPTYNDPVNPGANDVAPFKQPRSSMAPTLMFLDGEPIAAYGSPGGLNIISVLVNTTMNLIDHRMTLWESVVAPRFAITSPANATAVQIEDGFDEEVLAQLVLLGYSFVPPTPLPVPSLGAVQAVIQIPESGKQYGAADLRRGGGVFAADEFME
jgi:gamma-glutamyltranspeptidase/glutathione hydrolase